MIRCLTLPIAFFCFCLCTNAQQLVINETDADTAGFDILEFIELYDGGTGNTPLDNHVLVFFNGAGGSSRGAYRVIDLSGLSTGADGFFLAAQAAVPGIADRVSANTGIIYDFALQNGEDAVAIYQANETDFPDDVVLNLGKRNLRIVAADLDLGINKNNLINLLYKFFEHLHFQLQLLHRQKDLIKYF